MLLSVMAAMSAGCPAGSEDLGDDGTVDDGDDGSGDGNLAGPCVGAPVGDVPAGLPQPTEDCQFRVNALLSGAEFELAGPDGFALSYDGFIAAEAFQTDVPFSDSTISFTLYLTSLTPGDYVGGTDYDEWGPDGMLLPEPYVLLRWYHHFTTGQYTGALELSVEGYDGTTVWGTISGNACRLWGSSPDPSGGGSIETYDCKAVAGEFAGIVVP